MMREAENIKWLNIMKNHVDLRPFAFDSFDLYCIGIKCVCILRRKEINVLLWFATTPTARATIGKKEISIFFSGDKKLFWDGKSGENIEIVLVAKRHYSFAGKNARKKREKKTWWLIIIIDWIRG